MLFALAQTNSEEAVDHLVAVAKDPEMDAELRSQAVFWLGQIPNAKTLMVIEEVLKGSDEPEMREQALMALSHHEGERAQQDSGLLHATSYWGIVTTTGSMSAPRSTERIRRRVRR